MMFSHFARFVVYRPWLAIFVSVLMVFLMSIGIKDFRMTNNPRTFFGNENPDYEVLKNLEAMYGNREVVVFVLHPHNDDVFTRANLDLLERMTQELWQMPAAIRVSSLTNFQHTEVNGDDLYTHPLIESALTLSDQQIAVIRSIALSEPALVRSAISDKGHVAAIAVNVTMDDERSQARTVYDWARVFRDRFQQQHPDVDIMLSGTVAFSDAMREATTDGLAEIFPFSIAIAVLILWLILRSLFATWVTMSVVFLSVLGALGAASAMGIVFQPITSFAPAIILTLSLADSMHLLISYQQQLRKGMEKQTAMVASLRVNVLPVILTSVTTAIGFVSLNTSESPPFRDLGNIVTIGVLLALWLALVFLPAVCMVTRAPDIRQEEGWSQRAMLWLTGVIIRYRLLLLVSTVLLMALLSSFVSRNEFNDVWSEYFDETFEVRRVSDFVGRELTGLHRIEMSIPARESGGIVEPEYLRKLDELRAWAEAQPEVVSATAFSDVIRRLNRNMNGGDPAFYVIPDNRPLAAQYLLMFEMSLPFGLGLDNVVSMDKDASLFAVVLKQTTSSNILRFKEKMDAWTQANFPDYMRVPAGGLDVMFAGVTKRNIESLLSGLLFSFVLITITMIVSLRSLKYGLYSMLPNIAPCTMAFGVWALVDGHVGLTDSVVACITLGIVVDDTIHFLSKYVQARREGGLAAEEAVRHSLSHVGVAIVATTVVLVADFATLLFSHFQPSLSLGLLTCITLVFALICDLLFLPPFLLVFDRRKSRAEPVAEERTVEAA